jgi:pimeloyl-ACP methyl ester carboxylesterase
MVFLHGYGLDLSYWLPAAEPFVESHRVILYDARGNGRSTGVGEHYRFTVLADDLGAVLQQLQVKNPMLCGHSMGGDTLLQFAVSYPEIAARQVLVDPPGTHNLWVDPLGYGLLLIGSSFFGLLGVEPPQKPLVPLFRWLFWSSAFQQSHPEVIDAWKHQFLGVPIRQLLSSMQSTAFRANLRRKLRSIRFPTLILRGSKDRLVLQCEVVSYQREIPGARLERVDGAGHMSLSEQPQKVAEWIASFLDV